MKNINKAAKWKTSIFPLPTSNKKIKKYDNIRKSKTLAY